MKYMIILLGFILFSGCNEDVETQVSKGAVSIPIGTYHSNCAVVGSNDSERTVLILSADGNRSIHLESFTGNPFCTGSPATGPAEVASMEISEDLLREDISYFDDSETGFVPFYLNGKDLYLGEAVLNFTGSDPETAFADFTNDPIPNSVVIYHRQ